MGVMKTLQGKYMIAKYRYIILGLLILSIIGCRDEIDPSIANTQFGMWSLHYEFLLSLLVLLGGYGLIVLGFIVLIGGLSGHVEWVMEAAGFTSRLANASPGLVMIIVGAYLVSKSKMDIKAIHRKDDDPEEGE